MLFLNNKHLKSYERIIKEHTVFFKIFILKMYLSPLVFLHGFSKTLALHKGS